MRRVLLTLGVVIALALQLVVAGKLLPFVTPLGIKFADTFHVLSGPPQAITSADLRGTGPGTLLSATTMPTLTATHLGQDLHAARVVYRSTDGDTGAATVVSGSVFIPAGTPPPGGWPVIAVGHGTVGIDNPCAPSLSDSLYGLVATVSHLTTTGYAVAVADYQGLGVKGVHPYTDARTAGRNMIDSVRALRLVFPGISDRWAAFGHSQGGGAAWAADEQAAGYAPELRLVGAAAMAPAADVSGLAQKAFDGRTTVDQRPAVAMIVESMARLHPELDRDHFRRGAGAEYWQVLTACSGPTLYERDYAIAQLGPKDLAPQSQPAADQLRTLLQAWALPQRPLSAPMSVWYGGADTLVDAQWTADAVKRACALGGTVSIEYEPTKGHGEFDLAAAWKWLVDRFAGLPAPDNC